MNNSIYVTTVYTPTLKYKNYTHYIIYWFLLKMYIFNLAIIWFKKRLKVVFYQTKSILYLLGTIFSGGWIHIWCCSRYLYKGKGVFGIDSNCVAKSFETQKISVLDLVFLWIYWWSKILKMQFWRYSILFLFTTC